MKTNELMTGNWVIAPTPEHELIEVQVEQIKEYAIMDKYYNTAFIGELAPIPITEDFLKKNGFIHKYIIEPDEYFPKGLYEWHKRIDDYLIEVRIEKTSVWSIYIYNDDGDNIAGIAVQYVHQLQNFLNILGIEMEVTP
jgi:hypothetical protein